MKGHGRNAAVVLAGSTGFTANGGMRLSFQRDSAARSAR